MTTKDQKDMGLGTRSHNDSYISSDTEADKEKIEISSTSNSSIGVLSKKDDQEISFEPIHISTTTRAVTSNGRRLSKDTLRSISLRRERSNNGYGVDELDVDAPSGLDGQPPGDSEKARSSAQNEAVAGAGENSNLEDDQMDPFEVGWDGGDDDPMNPRSMPKWRKWVIVGITSFGSLCV